MRIPPLAWPVAASGREAVVARGRALSPALGRARLPAVGRAQRPAVGRALLPALEQVGPEPPEPEVPAEDPAAQSSFRRQES